MQIALVLYFSGALSQLVAAQDYPDRLTILSLLENRQFEELENLLGSYQVRYERSEIDERLLAYSLETLSNSNPENQTILNDWVEQRGGSFIPYLVRAYYYYGVAWSWRGHRSESETAPHRLANMENFLQLAAEDITQASQLNPRLSAADALVLRVLMMLDGEEYKKETLKQALRINPDSYLVRASYIWGMKPGWGGKPEELLQFMKEIESLVEEHPHFKTLLGYADYIFAESLTEKKRFEEAGIHFDFAVDKGADHIVYRERGINYYNLKKYELALKDFDSALGLWPQNPKTLRWRSHALQRLKDNESALKDLDLAVRLVPMDRYVLMAHALLSRKMRLFEQVLGDYKKALFYNNQDADIWFARGMHYSHELVNFEAAGHDFKIATQFDASKPAYWYEYATVLHYQLDCSFVVPLERYLSLCQIENTCQAGELKWALHSKGWLAENNKCQESVGLH